MKTDKQEVTTAATTASATTTASRIVSTGAVVCYKIIMIFISFKYIYCI